MGRTSSTVDRLLGLGSAGALRQAASAQGWVLAVLWTLSVGAAGWLVYPDGPLGGMRRPPLLSSQPGSLAASWVVPFIDGLWMVFPYALLLLCLRAVARCVVARRRAQQAKSSSPVYGPAQDPSTGRWRQRPDECSIQPPGEACLSIAPGLGRDPWREGRFQSVRFVVVGYRFAMDVGGAAHPPERAPIDWILKMANGAQALLSESQGRFIWFRPLGRKSGLRTFESWQSGLEVNHRGASHRVVRTWRSPPLWPLPDGGGGAPTQPPAPADASEAAEQWVLLEGPFGQWLRLCYTSEGAPVIWEGHTVARESLELQ